MQEQISLSAESRVSLSKGNTERKSHAASSPPISVGPRILSEEM